MQSQDTNLALPNSKALLTTAPHFLRDTPSSLSNTSCLPLWTPDPQQHSLHCLEFLTHIYAASPLSLFIHAILPLGNVFSSLFTLDLGDSYLFFKTQCKCHLLWEVFFYLTPSPPSLFSLSDWGGALLLYLSPSLFLAHRVISFGPLFASSTGPWVAWGNFNHPVFPATAVAGSWCFIIEFRGMGNSKSAWSIKSGILAEYLYRKYYVRDIF